MENNTTVAASTIFVLEKFGLDLALVWLLKFWFTVSKKNECLMILQQTLYAY